MGMKERQYPGQRTDQMSDRERKNRLLARRAAAEGMVLLENDGVLPLKHGAKLALFGEGARRTIKGGTGSGDVNSRDWVTVEQGLIAAGFEIVNGRDLDALDAAYAEAYRAWKEAIYAAAGPEKNPGKLYTAHAKTQPQVGAEMPMDEEACHRAEAGIYVLSRTAGENADRRDREGDYCLSARERSELEKACRVCRKMIVVLNTGGIMDLGFMDQLPISALVLMGQAGVEGGSALADVLSGAVNPSGRLTDTWARQYLDYPSSAGFGSRRGNFRDEYYTDGIYVGYRYFDTFGVRPRYPFGYGLSYTAFALTCQGAEIREAKAAVALRVQNTGSFPGRQVVQLYVSCPAAEQRKELKRLAAFGKTRELRPGESQELRLSFPLERLASFRRQSWMLEKGDYILLPGFSSADCAPALRLTLAQTVSLTPLAPICELLDSLKEIEPDGSARLALEAEAKVCPAISMDAGAAEAARLCSRTEKRPEPLLEAGRKIAEAMTAEEKAQLVVGVRNSHSREVIGAAGFSVPGAAGETAAFPEHGVPGMVLADGPAGLRLQQRYEINPEDGEIYRMNRFETLENRFFGKMATHAGAQSQYQFATAIPVGTLLAQSFDPELLESLGEMIAEEMREFGVTVWLAPGMNIHRNPLCGRNFEYYSEDPLISGEMAAAITRGVQKQGDLAACIKHFACNNQEEDRFHVTAVVSQRALREIYLKGFEIAIRESQPLSIMTSYNRVNSVHSANSRDLCTTAAREEWGFEGFIMTDWTTTNSGNGCSAAKCILAGNDLVMPGTEGDLRDIEAALHGDHDRPLPEEKLTESAARLIGAALRLGKAGEAFVEK